MEVVFAKSYLKDLRNLPGHIITAADEVADKLHAAKNLVFNTRVLQVRLPGILFICSGACSFPYTKCGSRDHAGL